MSKIGQVPLILIVDDDPISLNMMNSILHSANYSVAAANGGEVCFEVLQKCSPDLILCDVLMPDLDGYDVCERLKADPKTAEIPLIFLTANKEPEALLKGFTVGAVDYITKPFHASELLARVKTHIDLKQSRDKLFETSRQLETINHRLNKLMEEKDNLLSIVAHDLRSPLAAITSAHNLMSKSFACGEQPAEYLMEGITSSCENANNLVQELLDIAELDQDKLLMELVPIRGNEFLLPILKSFESRLKEKSIALNFIQSSDNLILLINPSKMARAINNLLHNALKFTPAGGTVEVSLQAVEDTAQIEISDTGIGIPEKLQSIIFDKFTKARRKGLAGEESRGLGMFITREIIQLHGGEISLVSENNQGTCFQITLPLKP